MMRLAVGISFYYDYRSLKRCLDSLTGHGHHIICVDGRYTDIPNPSDVSMDASRELVWEYDDALLFTHPGPEVYKRNKILELCGESFEYCLMIDSDEYILPGANWEEFKQNMQDITRMDNGRYNIYGVRAKLQKGSTSWPRLWYRPYDMEYYLCHNVFKNKLSGRILHSPTAAESLIDGITIASDDSLRTEEYMMNSAIYQKALLERENKIRLERFGMADNLK